MAVRRVILTLLGPVGWAPPGIDPERFRAAMAEDVVDLISMMTEVTPGIATMAVDRPLAEAIAWPGMPIYELPARTADAAFAAAGADGYDQAVVIAADAPDVPGLVLAKLLRPLTTRPVAVAATGEGGPLLGVATRLPAPGWLPGIDLDTTPVGTVTGAAPEPGQVAVTRSWRRLRGPAELAALDPAVEGWEVTRALLGG